MNFLKPFSRQPTTWIFAEMIALVFVNAFIDFLTGYEVSFFIFYGVPIYFVAWFCDKKLSLLTALIAGICWWWADLAGGHPYLHNWHEGYETIVRLGFFIFIAIGSSALKTQRDIAETRVALLEHTQRLEHEIIGISEREQQRIGQDLHDGICQFLAGIGCAASSLKDDLAKMQLRVEAGVAEELATLLQDAVVQTRNLARGLVPLKMNDVGLASALEELAVSVTRLAGTPCSFESSGPPVVLNDSASMHLYRIAQEALNNAIKHGKARNLALSLSNDRIQTTLRIADDGSGLSQTARAPGGMGLNIMNYRARLCGGELRIEEPRAGGTIVFCTISSAIAELNERAA